MSTYGNPAETAERTLVITRTLDAPRELVWNAWTEPERVKHWWGPRGFTAPVVEIDLRVGGEYFNCMRSSEGEDYWSKGVFREIIEPERLAMTDSFSDAEGNIVPASDYGMSEDWPLEMLVTITFEEHEGKTKLTLRHGPMPESHEREMCEEGWNETLDKLSDYLKSEHG